MNKNQASKAPLVDKKTTSRDWRDIYAGRLVITDLLVLIWVVFGVQILWFGLDTADLAFRGSTAGLSLNYTAVSVILIASWMTMLGVYGSRGYRVLGTGPDEYKLIANSSLRLFGLLAIVAFLFHIDVARGYILIAFPMGTLVLFFSRWMWRQWLVVQRLRGRFTSRVILVGSQVSASGINRELSRQPGAGYLVVGVCVPSGFRGEFLPDTQIPVLGDVDSLEVALDTVCADTVVVTSSAELSPMRMRELSWSLEPGKHHLVVAPSLTDIGGPRIHTRPVAGLPLIHVETPRYEGLTLFAKRAFDVFGSGLLILVLTPLLVAICIAIGLSGSGPIFFRQERIGINGERFRMLKFRSMIVGAELKLEEMRGQQVSDGNSVLFKMKHDPRVTPVGHYLRRFSLDELPQLFNVLLGKMSLVGPRPPLEIEVEKYDTHVHRRFLVKPGITGLWQISGRSNLSWEDSVRLDLYYVENWSIMGDLIILWRTARAVLVRDGAY
ncbi:sugar transferase [Cryobacterium sp. 5B3]|uniref:sugar transferase n=1 Tax=Cryobacterium sp. 5B3 TaxID=3048586 RepID=UPI002AB4EC5E|nr:sugar transferase [Cryobacterium sp. 5B3]MDY7540920.1 sugar transferase [Cryobacterium sp. 5B3]MEB0276143.1 sugar transferase [Cryobacterium sp. 5B3]